MGQSFYTGIPGFTVRFAEIRDSSLILDFIKQLAVYEKLEHEVTATQADIQHSLFEKQQAEVLIAEENGEPVGFALYFYNYSTFLGRANLYLEDLFVKSECRGKGYGKALLKCLAQIAVNNGCARLDWWCLDWNKSSVAFYKSFGAVPMDEWTVFRLTGEALEKLAGE